MLYFIRYDRLTLTKDRASKEFLWAFPDKNRAYHWGYSVKDNDHNVEIKAGDYTYWGKKHIKVYILR